MESIDEKRQWHYVEELIDRSDKEGIREFFDKAGSDEIAHILSHLNNDQRVRLVELQTPLQTAEMIEELHESYSYGILEQLSVEKTAAIIGELKSNDQADILGEFNEEDARAVMDQMDKDEAADLRKLIGYREDSAGGLMITEFLAFDESLTVREVADHLREKADEYRKYNVQYIYVTGAAGFIGVLQMRDLVLNKPNQKLSEIAIKDALTVNENAGIEELINFFDKYDFYGVPVLNDTNELVGLVMRKEVMREETEMAQKELLETQGIVGGEEIRTLPVLLRSKRRLSWLSVNILLNIAAASVIAFHQETLEAVIALAVFLPIISDMSGCSGNQAVAVSLRELSLGVVKPYEVGRVWLQEVSVGLINGLALGALIGAAAWLWKGNIYLGLVVGGALALNTVIAVSIGGTIPLLLKRLKVDPALASGPILTTITDMLGFFLALTFAGMALGQIGNLG